MTPYNSNYNISYSEFKHWWSEGIKLSHEHALEMNAKMFKTLMEIIMLQAHFTMWNEYHVIRPLPEFDPTRDE